jgi:hypothetical protein
LTTACMKIISALAILATLIAYLADLKDESEPSKGTIILLSGISSPSIIPYVYLQLY